jgi:hypothetical protein
VLFTRYAFMPNHLQRCVPCAPNNQTIFQHAGRRPTLISPAHASSRQLTYLTLIAAPLASATRSTHGIVRAYWIGNALLTGRGGRLHRPCGSGFARCRQSIDHLLGRCPLAPSQPASTCSTRASRPRRLTLSTITTAHQLGTRRGGVGKVLRRGVPSLIWGQLASTGGAG